MRDPPLAPTFTQAHLCDTPVCNISRDDCAIPHKTKHKYFAILSLQVSRDMKIGKTPTPIKIKLALPSPLPKKLKTPPVRGGILWACLSASDFQGEVGEVFGEIGGELLAKFKKEKEDFRASFAGENHQKHFPPKLHRKVHHQTSLRGSGLWRTLYVGFPAEKTKMPGAHKNGGAISGPRITGGKTTDMISAAPQQSEICVKFSVFRTVFDVKFW